jgi:hypothetical protein
LGSTEVRLSGNELSAQTKYVLQKKKNTVDGCANRNIIKGEDGVKWSHTGGHFGYSAGKRTSKKNNPS